MYDVEQRLYTTVIREMIRHENDVTNHRIMWLLIGQGLIANAYVTAGPDKGAIINTVAPVGILLTLSTFMILYKSYQARGYLQLLGDRAKIGTLPEELLPLAGWPRKRIRGWREEIWPCPWLGKASDLLEPYMFLPVLLMAAWLFLLFRHWFSLPSAAVLGVALLVVIFLLCLVCILWVRWESADECESSQSISESRRTFEPSASTQNL